MSTLAQALQWVSISDAARIAGTTPSVLRIWEQRYGWPSPRRSPAGYRRFTPADVEVIRQVVARVQLGDSPAELPSEGSGQSDGEARGSRGSVITTSKLASR